MRRLRRAAACRAIAPTSCEQSRADDADEKAWPWSWRPGFRVNGIAPGALLEPAGSEEAGLLTELITPRARCTALGALNASTRSLTFLVENRYMTGQVIPVDGGLLTT